MVDDEYDILCALYKVNNSFSREILAILSATLESLAPGLAEDIAADKCADQDHPLEDVFRLYQPDLGIPTPRNNFNPPIEDFNFGVEFFSHDMGRLTISYLARDVTDTIRIVAWESDPSNTHDCARYRWVADLPVGRAVALYLAVSAQRRLAPDLAPSLTRMKAYLRLPGYANAYALASSMVLALNDLLPKGD